MATRQQLSIIPPGTQQFGGQQPREQPLLKGADYHKLAHLMSRVPETSIFRTFREVTLFNLLSLQAELSALVEDFEDHYKADMTGEETEPTTGEPQDLFRSFLRLRESNGGQSLQYNTVLNIRYKLKEYPSEISRLEKPEKVDLKNLRDWFSHPTVGGNFLPLLENMWGTENDDDQIILTQKDEGLMRASSTWIMLLYDWVYGKRFGKPEVIDAQTGSRYYPDSSVKKIAKVTTSVIAALIPGIVILGLNYLETTVKRIGTMLACTALFAFVLSFWTQADVVDVFAATGAFAAVEVVFIGSAITNGTGTGG
ncbi:hypothetical protein B7494_g2020 [Chlorociboria aeruginascens]|nr:hypothetical protein B7494_g2020 [Chlorociboria aeruginascens]